MEEKINSEEKKLLDPKNDYVFKRIFGWEGNEKITGDLISSIIGEEVKDVDLDGNKILERDLIDEKLGELDVKAKIGNDMECDIEIQFTKDAYMTERILYYWSKMYNKTIKKGRNYIEGKRIVIILIANYNLKELRKTDEMLTKWQIKEVNDPKLELTNKLEFYILELKKIKEESKINEKLKNWVKFMNNPEEIKMGSIKDEYIKQAYEELEKLGDSEEDQERALNREMFIMKLNGIEKAGIEDGKEIGIKIGKKER